MTDPSSEAPTEAPIPLLVLVGPTASGKTALACALAERFGGEIVGADSRQIYRLMDIGTAKPSAADRARVPHHLLDVVWPDEPYTLAQYQEDAVRAIAAVHARERLPLLVGGTGLYIRAVVDGLAIPRVAPDLALRAALEADAARDGPAALHARLAALDPAAAASIAPTNVRRVIRALEVCLLTGQPFSAQRGVRPTPYRPLPLGLSTERATLYGWADRRVDAMLAAGLVAEVEGLVARGYSWGLPAMSSLGYREIGAYLRGEVTLAAATERIKLATHAYIRRQLTWFRPDARLRWLDTADPALVSDAVVLVEHWLEGQTAHDG
ncbi:MAG TPA: tRNA (adenosine(37)-N6)-dimethylallyltransferase MiaA [Ktedonobacterales bacterium]